MGYNRCRHNEENRLATAVASATTRASLRGNARSAKRRAGSRARPTGSAGDRSRGKRRFRLTLRHKIAATVWISIIIFSGMILFRETVAQLGSWGYVGAFVISAISSATVVLPAPGGAMVLLMAADYHPLPLGLAAGLGTTLGSLTAYVVGAQARTAFQRRRLYALAYRLMHRFGHVVLFVLNLLPVSPGDFGGILAGATRYPVRKFLVAVGLASIIKMVVLTYGAVVMLEWLERWLPSWGQLFTS